MDKDNIKNFLLKIYAQEKIEHDNGNYIFYHAHNWDWNFLSDIYKQLYNIIKKDNVSENFQFLRFGIPGLNPFFCKKTDSIFMNSALFGNSSWFLSCSIYYFLSNRDLSLSFCKPQKILQLIFQDVLKLEKMYIKYKAALYKLEQLHKKCSLRHGEILLISIPKDRLNNVVLTYGGEKIKEIIINNQKTSDPKIILDEVKNNPLEIKGIDNLEWRLILGEWKDGKYVPNPYTNDPHNGPAIYSFHMGDEQKYEEYKKLRDEIFVKIKADIQNTQIRSKL